MGNGNLLQATGCEFKQGFTSQSTRPHPREEIPAGSPKRIEQTGGQDDKPNPTSWEYAGHNASTRQPSIIDIVGSTGALSEPPEFSTVHRPSLNTLSTSRPTPTAADARECYSQNVTRRPAKLAVQKERSMTLDRGRSGSLRRQKPIGTEQTDGGCGHGAHTPG